MSMEQEDYAEEASEYEQAPDDFEAEFDLEDTKVPEHPVIVDVTGHGQASARLVRWEIIEDLQDGGDQLEFDADMVAELLRDHYKSPSFENLRGDDVRHMHLSSPDNLLGAIMPGMDAQIDAQGNAQVDTKNQERS